MLPDFSLSPHGEHAQDLGEVPRRRPREVPALDHDADAIDIDVERNMLTVKAERRPATKADDVQMELSERPLGVFSRQIVLADTLDTEHIQADYDAGVLTLRIPIAERAKPRKITIGVGSGHKEISG